MITISKVENLDYYGRYLNFYAIIENSIPIFSASIFLLSLSKSGKSLNTNKSYATNLKKFFTFLAAHYSTLEYGELKDNDFSYYINTYLKNNFSLSKSSINHHLAVLNEFYKYIYSIGLTNHIPSLSNHSVKDATTKLSPDDLTTELFETYINEDTFKSAILGNVSDKNLFINERNNLALKLGYYAGFRTHELIKTESFDNLNISNLRMLLPKENNWKPKSISLRIKGKGKKSRKVPISVELADSIYNFIWGRASHINTCLMSQIDGTPIKNESFGTNLFRQCKNLYISNNIHEKDEWSKRTFHTLRKCFTTNSVSYCYENNYDPRVFVRQWLGHADYSTTQIYIFFEALLYERNDVISTLNLSKTKYGKEFNKKRKNTVYGM